jgi:IS30 family transposase
MTLLYGFMENDKKDRKELYFLCLKIKGSFKIVTINRGKEFACYSPFENQLGIKVYFADSYSSWNAVAMKIVMDFLGRSIQRKQT